MTREIRSWLSDMDGVLVHEGTALPGAADFVGALQAADRPFLVLTNNSIFTPRDLRARHTGSTRREQVDRFPFRPSEIVDSIADLVARV